jgi:hypothetical protein
VDATLSADDGAVTERERIDLEVLYRRAQVELLT